MNIVIFYKKYTKISKVGKDVCHDTYQQKGCLWQMTDPRVEDMVVNKLSQVSAPDDLCKAMSFCN